jgi:hypothetical protein
MFDVRRIIKLIPIIWGFFIWDSYCQTMGKPSISTKDTVRIEINNFRMVDVIEQIELYDFNKKRLYIFKCNENEYYLDKKNNILFQKKIIELKVLKKKRGKFFFNVKVISKTGKQLYIKEFRPSYERTKKLIKIQFI